MSGYSVFLRLYVAGVQQGVQSRISGVIGHVYWLLAGALFKHQGIAWVPKLPFLNLFMTTIPKY